MLQHSFRLLPFRQALMRPYTGKEVQPGTTPGYVRAGYGNYGNLDILANYLFRLSQKDKLNVRFQMDGMDGKLTLPFTDSENGMHFIIAHVLMWITHTI